MRLLVAFIWILLATPRLSHAAACCSSATAYGVGRLLKWEQFATGFRTSLDNELTQRNEIWAMGAVTSTISLYSILPWRWNAIDDAQVGLRYQFPNVGIIGNVIIPGYASKVSSWGFSLATSFEKSWDPWFAQLNVGTTWYLPSTYGPSHSLWRGFTAQSALVGGVDLPHDLVATVSVQYLHESAQYLDGDPAFREPTHKIPIAASLSWKFDPHWMLVSSLSSDFTQLTGQIGVRYGYF